ncbi:TIGR02452 family protein [Pelomyxa schiedti]|nr:TIGR02452 family protein [Pelomyxa schiedti]
MDIHKAALGYAFDPDLFLAAWLKYQSNRAAIALYPLVLLCSEMSEASSASWPLIPPSAALNTKLYPNDYTYTIPTPPSTPCCPVEVREADCIEVALELKQRGLNPAVLNMASASHPGGGYKTGAGAQEENLHRRTSLFHCLEDPYRVNPHRLWRYPIPEFGVLYSPNVPTFRQSEAHAYAFLDTVQELSYISAAAYNQPPLDTDRTTGDPILSGKVLRDTEHKIHVIFQVAIENGHDSLVLSALGCGAYGNPPVSIALLIKQALRQYGQYFQTVAIAVIDDHNTRKIHNPHGNVEPFKRVFS